MDDDQETFGNDGLGIVAVRAAGFRAERFEREAKDRTEIEKLMWRYARALDTEDADVYVATYTPDGQFGDGANAIKGHDALHKYIVDLHRRNVETESKTGQKRPAMYHTSMNPYLEFIDKDHVSAPPNLIEESSYSLSFGCVSRTLINQLPLTRTSSLRSHPTAL
jgi:hypothetical protein